MNSPSKSIVWILILTLLSTGEAIAQYKYTRVSLEVNAGVSVPNTSITGSLGAFSELGVRVASSRYLSGRLSFGVGKLSGSQDVKELVFPRENIDNYTKFTTTYYSFSGSGMLNVERLLNLRNAGRKFHRLNTFLVVGAGYMYPDVEVNRVDGQYKNYKNNVRFITNNFGLDFKYFLSNRFDLNLGAEYRLVQTYYLDGAFSDKKYDGMYNGYIGISYNIGANSDKKHLEWFNLDGKEDVIFVPFKDEPKKGDDVPIVNEDKPIRDSLAMVEPDKPNDTPDDTTDYNAGTKDLPLTPDTQEPKMVIKHDSNTTIVISQSVVEDTVVSRKIGRHTDIKGRVITKQDTTNKVQNPVVVSKEPAVVTTNTGLLNDINGIVPPMGKYNVIVGTYSGPKYAFLFRNKLRKEGFQAALFRDNDRSKMVRVCVYYGDDRKEANKQLRLYMSKFNGQAWLHIYNK